MYAHWHIFLDGTTTRLDQADAVPSDIPTWTCDFTFMINTIPYNPFLAMSQSVSSTYQCGVVK